MSEVGAFIAKQAARALPNPVLREVQDKSRKFVESAGALASEIDAYKVVGVADKTGERKQAIVRGSDVLTAIQYGCAKFGFRILPGYVKSKLEGFLELKVAQVIAEKTTKTIAGSLPGVGFLKNLVSASLSQAVSVQENEKIVALIRKCFSEVRREFNRLTLKQARGKRKVKDVQSRHPGKSSKKRVKHGLLNRKT